MEKKSFFYKAYSPFLQSALIIALSFTLMMLVFLLDLMGIFTVAPKIYWMISAACMLYFALFSSIFSLSTSNFNTYFLHSLLGFTGVAIFGSLVAWLFSGQGIDEAGSFRWIYFILTFCFILFLGIVNGMLRIVVFAQREDKKMQDGM